MKIFCNNTKNIIIAVAFACICLVGAETAEAACYWAWDVVRYESCPVGKSLQLNYPQWWTPSALRCNLYPPYNNPIHPLYNERCACFPCGGYACMGGGGGLPFGTYCANNSGYGGCEAPGSHPVYDWVWRCDGECQTFPSGIDPLPTASNQLCVNGGTASPVSGNGTNSSRWTWTCVGSGTGHTNANCYAKKPCVYDNYSCSRSPFDVKCENTYPENCGKSLPVSMICSARDVNGTCSGVPSQSNCVTAGIPCANTTENCASCPLEPGIWREVEP